MKVTLCVGGSVLVPEEVDEVTLKKTVKAVKALVKAGHQVHLVVGGGATARKYIQMAKVAGASQVDQDLMGIAATRLNARLVIAALGRLAAQEVMVTVESAVNQTTRGLIPVMGGVSPGQTTDAVAASLAARSGSDLLIFVTDVDGIYTEDPKKSPKAQKIEKMTTEELVKRFGSGKMAPGMKAPVDPLAAKLIHRHGMKTIILGKRELDNLVYIVEGGKHSGTTVVA